MNALEVEFCFRISFSLHVTDAVYKKYHTELANHAKMCAICAPFVPAFPKLDPYRSEETKRLDAVPGAGKWSRDNDFDAVDAGAHLKEHPYFRHMHMEVTPVAVKRVDSTPHVVDHGAPMSYPAAGAPNPASAANPVKISYAPILNQCINTWGVPTPIAVSGPMYHPLFYS
eukprot:scaffold1499_cov255-Pinguiococcus_pyrenoidosus.AAC.30